MAKSIWNADDRRALLLRFDLIQAEERPRWGKMNASQMVRHCTLPILAAMGQFPVAQQKTILRFWLMRKLIIYWLPWPKGAATAPEFIVTDDGELCGRRAALRAAVDTFVSRGESQTFQTHAIFGELTAEDWGALSHRHLDHHLKQFGA